MNLIDHKTPGVTSDDDIDITGMIVVVRPIGPERLQVRKLQIVRATGGQGCNPVKYGTAVYVTPLWEELPVGSGKLVPATEDTDGWQSRRGKVIGICTPELLAEVSQDPDDVKPGDINALAVMVAGGGKWGLAPTVKEALKKISRRTIGADVGVWVTHEESWINEMGFLSTYNEFMKEGRRSAQVVSGDKGVNRTLAEAEKYAAQLIQAARTGPEDVKRPVDQVRGVDIVDAGGRCDQSVSE